MLGTVLASNPTKGITLIILGVMIPYLIYAFLGGAIFVIILTAIAAGIWWLAARKKPGSSNLTT
jgi:hypothetical protein